MDKKIVDKKSFAEQVKSRVEERLGADCRVQVEDVCKNNGVVHTGLRISVDKINISPVIYRQPVPGIRKGQDHGRKRGRPCHLFLQGKEQGCTSRHEEVPVI